MHTQLPPHISRQAGVSGALALTAELWPLFHHIILPLLRAGQFLEPGYQWTSVCKIVIYQCHFKNMENRYQSLRTEFN
jgi:hypothetical protein